VTLIPGCEVVGHNSLPRDVFGDASEAVTSTNLASNTATAGVVMLIDGILAQFPTAPFVHIGWDEVDTSGVAQALSAPGFCAEHRLASCTADAIANQFLTTINDHVRVKTNGKVRLMAYENVNTPGTANHTVVTQPWWINGGNGYMEDQIKSNLHGNTLPCACTGSVSCSFFVFVRFAASCVLVSL
jgi:hypothetical protein